MIMLVQGRSNFDNNVHIQEAISSLKKEKKGMTVHELVQWMHDHPMVTNPVLHLYSNLRNALLGARFWNQLSKIRYAHDYMKPIVYVIDLAEHLEAEELTRLEQEAVDSAALSNMSRQKRGRRGSLLELSRSGKLPAPSVPAEDIVTQLDYDIAITGASTFEDEYRPDLRRKKPETVPKRPKVITKKPRRQSLSKALSFVKGIGSSKSNNKKTDSVTPETTQKDRRHIISIKLAIDVIKSVASGSGKNNDNKSKKKKQKKNKIDAEPMNLERTACTTQTVGWKSAEKYQQY